MLQAAESPVEQSPQVPHVLVTDEEIFEAHVGGKLSVALKAPLDTLDLRVGEAVAAA
jgi:malate dehydrogenase (oxaloacetate-decarboxylating)